MPYCPTCRAEYREGFTECSDCLVALVDELPEADVEDEQATNLITVYAEGRIQADVIRSALEGNGIPAVLAREGYTSAYPLTVGAIGEGRVLVREEDRERALEVIAAAGRGALDLEAPNEPPFTHSALFWFFATILCIIAVLAVLTGIMPAGP